MTPEMVQFEKQKIAEVLTVVNGIVVSLDRLTMAHIGMSEDMWKDAVFDYFMKSKALMSLPSCRTILSAQFSTDLGADDMDELERVTIRSEYWSYKEFLDRHLEKSNLEFQRTPDGAAE